MSTTDIKDDNFESIISDGGIVLVECWASWCRPCKAFAPIYEKVAKENPDHVFGKLDTQAESELVSSLGIKHVPSLLLYRDGVQLFGQPGTFSEEALQDIIRQAETVDMKAVAADKASDTNMEVNE